MEFDVDGKPILPRGFTIVEASKVVDLKADAIVARIKELLDLTLSIQAHDPWSARKGIWDRRS